MSATAVSSFDARVEVAFTTGPDSATPAWEDMTSRVLLTRGLSVTRGRPDQFSTIQPSTFSCTFENPTGEFTAGNASSAHYPNVLLNRRIRYSIRLNTAGGAQIPGNFLTANQASVETSVADYVAAFGYAAPTITQSALHPQDGTKSLLATWPASASAAGFYTLCGGLTIGRTYTFSTYVFVPAGSPDPAMFVLFISAGTSTSTKGALTRISVTFTATAAAHFVGIFVPSSAAGNQCFADSFMLDEGSTVGTFTTSAPPIYYRFDGCVNQWPTTFNAVGNWSECQITATDRTKRSNKLRDVISCEYILDTPAAFYPLSEVAGSTTAGNTAVNPQPPLVATQVGSGGALAFGSATGPASDGLTALSLAPVNVTNGLYLLCTRLSTSAGGFGGLTLECFMLTTAAVAQKVLRGVDLYSNYAEITTTAAGKIQAVGFFSYTQTVNYTITSAASFNDGLTHHVALTESVSAGTMTATLYVDGTSVGTASYSAAYSIGVQILHVGGSPQGGLFNGTIAHVAAYTAPLSGARLTQHSLAGSTGFAAERSDQRITRLASYAGFAAGDVQLETGQSNIAAQQTSGASPIDLMRAVEATENGLLFINGVGALIFQSRSHRYNQTAVLTLATDTYDESIAASYDEFGVANEVTASRPNGAKVLRSNPASQSTLGQVYTVDLSTLLTTDNEVADAADWRIFTSGTPQPRYPTIPVDLMTQPTLQSSVLTLGLGDMIALSGLPTQAAATTASLNVEGWTEQLSDGGWGMNLNTSPAFTKAVWQLDSTTYSVLDSTTRLAY